MGYYDFPHTRNYDTDLGYLIKQYLNLREEVDNLITSQTIVYADPLQWSIDKQYRVNTIVINGYNAYLSKQPVPLGIEINNTDYWLVVGDFIREFDDLRENIVNANEYSSTTVTAPRNKGNLVWINDVLYIVLRNLQVGDKYIVDDNINKITVEEYINDVKTYINVKLYGAKGDGLTDDTQSLLNAINDITGTNKTLFFPNGVYLFNQTLNVKDFSLIGDNATLKYSGNSIAIKILHGFKTKISNFRINGENKPDTIGIYANGGLNTSHLDDLYVTNFDIGLQLINSYLCYLTNINSEYNTSYGLYLTEAYNATLERITIVRNNINGFIQSGAGLSITGMDISAAKKYALQLDYCHDCVFTNIYYEDNENYVANKVITSENNGIQNCVFNGLYLTSSNNDIYYIYLGGNDDAYNVNNTFNGLKIHGNNTPQKVFYFYESSRNYPRCYNNILLTKPLLSNIIESNLYNGNGKFITPFNNNLINEITNNIITTYNQCYMKQIDVTTNSSGDFTINQLPHTSIQNMSVIGAISSSNDFYQVTNIRYYSSEITGKLNASENYKIVVIYTLNEFN